MLNFPYSLSSELRPPFPDNAVKILSLPHRIIFDTYEEAMEFIESKVIVRYTIYNGRIYVEYLNDDEVNLQIQDNNWKI